MTRPGTRSRLGTAFLLLSILVLGFLVFVEQRRVSRLRDALSRFKCRAGQDFYSHLNHRWAIPAQTRLLPLSWGKQSTAGDGHRPACGVHQSSPFHATVQGFGGRVRPCRTRRGWPVP